MPERTARQLRRSWIVVTGTDDWLHRLAVALPALAVASAGFAATDDGPTGAPVVIAPNGKETDGGNRVSTTLPGRYWTALAVLAVVGIGLAAVAIRRGRRTRIHHRWWIRATGTHGPGGRSGRTERT